MNRRESLEKLGFITGGVLIGSSLLLHYHCSSNHRQGNSLFDTDQLELISAIVETILPNMDKVGAKSVDLVLFMTDVVRDCYSNHEQDIFLSGLNTIETIGLEKYRTSFTKCLPKEREEIIMDLDDELANSTKKNILLEKKIFTNSMSEEKCYWVRQKNETPRHYFQMIKELTILSYFTSESGATKSLRYEKISDSYNGCIPYNDGDKAWFYST